MQKQVESVKETIFALCDLMSNAYHSLFYESSFSMLHLGIGDSVPIRTCSCTFLPRLARLQVSGKRCRCAASAKSAKALPKGRKKERKKAWLNLALNNYIPSIFITLVLFSAVPSLSLSLFSFALTTSSSTPQALFSQNHTTIALPA